MVLSIQGDDARDVELQHEMQEAFEVYLHAAGEGRTIAKSHYLKLLAAVAARIQHEVQRRLRANHPRDFEDEKGQPNANPSGTGCRRQP